MEPLRPLTLGEIIDRAVSFWRTRWRPLFLIYLGYVLAGYVALKAGQVLVQQKFPALSALYGSLTNLELFKQAQPGELWAGGAIVSASLLVYMLITSLGAVAVTRYAALQYLGVSVGPREAIRESVARATTAFSVAAITLLWTLLVVTLATAPGAGLVVLGVTQDSNLLAIFGGLLAVAGMTVGILWSILRFFLVTQLVAMEDVPLGRLISRSGQLTSGSVAPGLGGFVKVRLTVLLTVMGLVILLVSIIGNVPSLVLQLAFAPAPTPWLFAVPAELIDTVFSALVSPIYVVFQTLVYLDMRVRREGLDLKLKLSTPQQALEAA